MPITRNLLVIMDAYAKSYEDVPDKAQLELINNIRKICKASIELLNKYGFEPCISEKELIEKCEKLHR
jgi:diadenosine tetraphosphate (Ap4A) HIT family hydrolase